MQPDSEATRLVPTELLATVGHEFRGPLTTIQGYATTLLRHEQHLSWQERQQFLGAIGEASAQLSKLVDRFLQLAQLEARAPLFHPELIDMRALVQEAITAGYQRRPEHVLLLPATFPQHEGLIERRLQSHSERETLWGDRRLLRLLLDLLLENALLYSPVQSLVELSVEPVEPAEALALGQPRGQAGRYQALIVTAAFEPKESLLLLRVRDHGIGIEPGQLSLIFRRFYRADNSLTRERNGLGLGLALCREIVTCHQGMLWVESVPGEGSTFSLVFPAQRVQAEVPDLQAEPMRPRRKKEQ